MVEVSPAVPLISTSFQLASASEKPLMGGAYVLGRACNEARSIGPLAANTAELKVQGRALAWRLGSQWRCLQCLTAETNCELGKRI
ncbi:MAG: hypothetical protein NVS3B5_05920 [Sphingomicrobium sp.]